MSQSTPATSGHPTPHNRAFWQTVVIGLLACGGISAAGYWLGIEPAVAQLAERREQIQELERRREKAAELRSDLAVHRKKLEDARKAVRELPLRLEPATAINHRLNRLADMATSAGISLNEMQPGSTVDGVFFQTIPIHIAGGGSYPACAAFLHTLRTEFPDMSVRTIDALNPTPGKAGNTVSFRFDLDWHTTPGGK